TTSIVAGTSVVPKAWSMLVAPPVPAAPASLPSPPEAPASGAELSEEQAVRAAARARAEPVNARRVKGDIGAFLDEREGGGRRDGTRRLDAHFGRPARRRASDGCRQSRARDTLCRGTDTTSGSARGPGARWRASLRMLARSPRSVRRRAARGRAADGTLPV